MKNKFSINPDVNLTDINQDDVKYYNHSDRRDLIKRIQKSQVIEYVDQTGKLKRTNEYKKRLQREKNDFRIWIDRVKKAIEAGKQIKRHKDEINYNAYKNDMELRDSKYRSYLEEIYGKERAQLEYDKYMERVSNRMDRLLSR